MENLTSDQLIKKLFDALDDEVQFCIQENIDIADASTDILKECQRRKVGDSTSLRMLKKLGYNL